MKKIILVLTFALMFLPSVYAQITPGILLGVNVNIESGKRWDAFLRSNYGVDDPSFGFEAGLMCDFKISSKFSIQLEVSYALIRTGFISEDLYDPRDFYWDLDMKYTYHTIEIPVLFKFTVLEIRDNEDIFVFAGPLFGYIFKDIKETRTETVYYPFDDEASLETDIKPKNSTAWGIVCGFGYQTYYGLYLESRVKLYIQSFGRYETMGFALKLGYRF